LKESVETQQTKATDWIEIGFNFLNNQTTDRHQILEQTQEEYLKQEQGQHQVTGMEYIYLRIILVA
jgi:hypothetical protein